LLSNRATPLMVTFPPVERLSMLTLSGVKRSVEESRDEGKAVTKPAKARNEAEEN
jgi:hypothetical protein